MPVLELQDEEIASSAPKGRPPGPRRPSSEAQQLHQYESELDDYLRQMASFARLDLGEVFSQLAAMSARLTAIRMVCVRNDTRLLAAFRTRQLDPTLEEVDRQFRSWSRQLAVRQQEWEMSKGGV